MTRLPRILAGVAVAAAVSLLAGACSAQPDAASVNGTSINQSQLNDELAVLSSNRAYIKAIDRASASSGQQVAGSAKGTYNSLWTAHILTGLITADAVHEYLRSHGTTTSRYERTVAWAVEAADYGPYWQGFPSSYRTKLTERTAELARLGAPALPAKELRSLYKQLSGYLFTRVCARAPVFATAAAAHRYATEVSAGTAGAGHAAPVDCYNPSTLDAQSRAFTAAVRSLPVGTRGRVIRADGGHEVVVVTRRVPISHDRTLRRTLGVVVATNSGALPQLQAVLSRAKVTVNPQYGSWQGSRQKGFQVVPPRAPGAA